MAAQLRHLLEVAAMPTVTIQVLPAIAHPVNASGFLMADDAVWVEHAAGGFVYTEKEIVSGLALRFDTLRGECYRVSESVALLERLEGIWKAGEVLLLGRQRRRLRRDGQRRRLVLVRDTADRDGTTLSVPAAAWQRFPAQQR